jgi:hypothetical protein
MDASQYCRPLRPVWPGRSSLKARPHPGALGLPSRSQHDQAGGRKSLITEIESPYDKKNDTNNKMGLLRVVVGLALPVLLSFSEFAVCKAEPARKLLKKTYLNSILRCALQSCSRPTLPCLFPRYCESGTSTRAGFHAHPLCKERIRPTPSYVLPGGCSKGKSRDQASQRLHSLP